MFTFEKLYKMGHEEVVVFSEPSCGLKAIVAIHDTTLGPALGVLPRFSIKFELRIVLSSRCNNVIRFKC